jgi:cephalosporin-C deacetylase-like acetyl esterase
MINKRHELHGFKILSWTSLFFLSLHLGSIGTGEELTVLSTVAEHAARPALPQHLREEAFGLLAKRRAAYEQLQTVEDVEAWKKKRREFFLRQLGELPPRSPLNAKITGKLAGDGYRIEKVIFESQPHHHVTGNLYLPETPGPHPAVIIPCGHSFNGKAADGYQRVSILMAKHGIAAFCYDPIGQGERYQTFDTEGRPLSADYQANPNSVRQLDVIPGKPRFNPVEEHTLVGIGSILVGRNTATYRIFDGMRAIDYLVSRSDIDAKRIGCTGNSGGGTLSAYLMALDERIVCAAPACYMTTFQRLLETSGPQDAEQNLFGQIAFGLDEADYVLLRAPQPTCLLAGTRDATFDITGTWDIYREAKRVFARYGYPERVDLVEADAPHGFTIQLREGAVRWMKRWLLGQDEPLAEPELKVWSDAELQCTPQGQVMWLLGERSVFDLNRAVEADLEKKRQAEWQGQSEAQQRDVVRATAGIRTLSSLPPLDAMHGEVIKRTGYRIEKRLLQSEDRLPLPALAFLPEQRTGDVCLYVHGAGKAVDASVGGPIEKLVLAGHMVLAVDLSGTGETANVMTTGQRIHWSRPLFGPDGESFWLAYLIGKSLVGIRAEDILAASRYLAQNQAVKGEPATIRLIAIGTAGPSALHALALEPQLYRALTLQSSLASWKDVVAAPLGNAHLTETVHGVLAHYDLPDLIRLSGGEKRVTMLNPIR